MPRSDPPARLTISLIVPYGNPVILIPRLFLGACDMDHSTDVTSVGYSDVLKTSQDGEWLADATSSNQYRAERENRSAILVIP